ncbi:MAG: molybdopterin-synthase adenylyltransferase MoeB [Cypionkella sp.]|uniref:HesA/MoeB/ThiF family protein n=1 Tax=Cypionkella sp. TaxID=2811411 RepID=UPI002ABB5068|nr:molybdopterin-synthase adenylyltransferase MoeB [Cypionkella sp.]MDZ4310194.1 molybdopterin-synthase adenylyltransferase MoeB [Cypionkella sp.]
MMLVIGLAVALWLLGWVLRTPKRLRWGAIATLWLAVVLLNVLLPVGHPLREMTGGDARIWLAVALGFGAVLGYRVLLKGLKKRAKFADPVVATRAFSSAEVERYARHILLREIGGPGQRRLKEARVLVVGAGGLGAPVLLYLAAAGVGVIGVIDDDTVDPSNLQRQIIHTDQRIGMDKVQSAEIAMRALNPYIVVKPYKRRLDVASGSLVAEYDLVLDGSDNFDTRYLVNRLCVAAGKPLVAGAMTQWEGQLSVYDPTTAGPCYECVFPVRPAPGMVPTCAEAGVAAPLPGVIGSMMAMEAVKLITGAGEPLRGRLLIHDALYGETRMIGVKRRADCAVCGVRH